MKHGAYTVYGILLYALLIKLYAVSDPIDVVNISNRKTSSTENYSPQTKEFSAVDATEEFKKELQVVRPQINNNPLKSYQPQEVSHQDTQQAKPPSEDNAQIETTTDDDNTSMTQITEPSISPETIQSELRESPADENIDSESESTQKTIAVESIDEDNSLLIDSEKNKEAIENSSKAKILSSEAESIFTPQSDATQTPSIENSHNENMPNHSLENEATGSNEELFDDEELEEEASMDEILPHDLDPEEIDFDRYFGIPSEETDY